MGKTLLMERFANDTFNGNRCNSFEHDKSVSEITGSSRLGQRGISTSLFLYNKVFFMSLKALRIVSRNSVELVSAQDLRLEILNLMFSLPIA